MTTATSVPVTMRSDREAQRWECPWQRRLLAAFTTFVGLPLRHREIIAAAREDGIFWRGDEVTDAAGNPGIFIRMYDETLTMREMGASAYIQQARESDGLLAAIPRTELSETPYRRETASTPTGRA